ncbi:MAG: peptidoglycan-binding domain-containing protein [Candidatus Kaistia colombiensis]|nr:MAG: peptidoglycan-binding domain-containing protein [Kaistia sp.]
MREREAPARRKRPPNRSRRVAQESESLIGRLADKIIENPGRAGGIALIAIAVTSIVSNAAFLQTKHHPDPLFVTRGVAESSPTPEPAAAATAAETVSVPLPKSRVAATQAQTQAAPSAPQPAAPKPVAAVAATTHASLDGNIVADTQKALLDVGFYDGSVDGVLGPQTKAAISAFEKRIGLIPTGQPSARLLGEMRKSRARAQLADPVSTGSIEDPAERARVKRVQEALNQIGYGPIDADGRGGGKTASAIRRFELDNGLPMTGAAGDAVIAKLVLIGAMNTL